jgi:hypothetical protein
MIIETRKGVMSQVAHVTDKVHPDIINSAYGWWFPEAEGAFLYDWEDQLQYAYLNGKAGQTLEPKPQGIRCRVGRPLTTRKILSIYLSDNQLMN